MSRHSSATQAGAAEAMAAATATSTTTTTSTSTTVTSSGLGLTVSVCGVTYMYGSAAELRKLSVLPDLRDGWETHTINKACH